MELRRSRQLLPRIEWRDSVPSTNPLLRELALADDMLPHGTLVVTANQTAGRGRAGRGWSMPPGEALAMSLLVRDFARSGLGPGWLPLIAGSAVASALQPYFSTAAGAETELVDGADAAGGTGITAAPRRVCVKWPNDVHVRTEADAEVDSPGLKLCGILCEMLPDGSAIVGMGVNLLLREEDLPTERATSLLAAGADVGGALAVSDADPAGADLADHVIAETTGELLRLVARSEADPGAVRARVLRDSATIGAQVRVHLPGGEIVDGRARALADDGALVVDLTPRFAPWAAAVGGTAGDGDAGASPSAARATGGQLTVSAGDVEHLR